MSALISTTVDLDYQGVEIDYLSVNCESTAQNTIRARYIFEVHSTYMYTGRVADVQDCIGISAQSANRPKELS